MKKISIGLIVLILLLVVTDTCQADWREGLASMGRRIQSASRRAIDWGAEKFRPIFERHIVPAGEILNETYYEETKKIIDSPRSFVADQTPGLGDIRSADTISSEAAKGDYTEAGAETASAIAGAATPPVLGTGVAATAKGLARIAGSYLEDEEAGTPLANTSLDETIRFFPNSVAGAVYLKREDVPSPRTVRVMYGQPGLYGSYVEIHANRESFSGPETEEMTAERFKKAIEKYDIVNRVLQHSDACFTKEYRGYPVVVFIHEGGRGRTAFFDYSHFRFNVICSNRYNSMTYIDAGIRSLMNNLGLAE
ncbi:MAG: hypothetical protein ISS34_01855 [Candidatus Omnitrophica bacterium]|nr:hypothetical protein [Candidatus Omnitrophota bacterium]